MQIKALSIDKGLGTQHKSLSFRGMPWVLNPYDYGVPSYGSITAYDAEKLFAKLACGNYLDIGEDKTRYEAANRIREKNLEFLDRVTSPSEQGKFIEHYKNLTGFPNLETISQKIENQFTSAVQKASRDLYLPSYKVEQAGYDGVCSVGRKKALPGSDLDKAYVIIRGTGSTAADTECVNQFKGKIWENTDQRILSYNHDDAAFPQVYTKQQLRNIVLTAEEKAKELCENKPVATFLERFLGIKPTATKNFMSEMFEKKLETYTTNYVDAGNFYINICERMPHYGNNGVTKESVKNVGFVLEAMREGKIFNQFGQINDDKITKTWLYKLVNLSQLHALKKLNDQKPKRLIRVVLESEFPKWNIDKQFRFVKALIKSACANNKTFTTEFANYFSKPGQDLFAPLIKALMR